LAKGAGKFEVIELHAFRHLGLVAKNPAIDFGTAEDNDPLSQHRIRQVNGLALDLPSGTSAAKWRGSARWTLLVGVSSADPWGSNLFFPPVWFCRALPCPLSPFWGARPQWSDKVTRLVPFGRKEEIRRGEDKSYYYQQDSY
jgi:hypothetical protein